jgi:pentapeptide MXKDX repeat protein
MNKNWTALSLALGISLLGSLATFAQGTGDAMKNGTNSDAMKGGAMQQGDAMKNGTHGDAMQGGAMQQGDAMKKK